MGKQIFAAACLVVLITVFLMASDAFASIAFSDDFENGSIDANRWVVGGRRTSWTSSDEGSWQWEHDEIVDLDDGYLRARAWGPTSGNSYGAVAWVRTVDDFNDGSDYTFNFTWEADVLTGDSHANVYYMQVTDGYVYPFEENHGWMWRTEGTADLLWYADDPGREGREYATDSGKLTWSIGISASESMARLYDGPNLTGSLIHEEALDTGNPWYIRFAVWDATSSGFPAGDSSLRLYNFEVPEPSALALVALGVLGLLLRRRTR